MKLSLLDEQEIRTFAKQNEALLRCVIRPEADEAHRQDNFFGEALTVAMFFGFARSLAEVVEGAVVVTKILTKSEELFTWVRKRLPGADESTKATLGERILILHLRSLCQQKCRGAGGRNRCDVGSGARGN